MNAIIVVTTILSMPGAPAEPHPADNHVERVVVFADRAEVTRAAVARCDNGTAAVLFSPLPESIDPRTLRGDVDGDAVAVGVSSQRVQLAEALDERVRALRTELQAADDELATIARVQADDNERARSINSYGSYFRALAVEEMREAKPDGTRWDQLLDFMSSSQTAQLTTQVARAAEQRTLQRKRERLAARLARLNPAEAPSSLGAPVAIKCGSSSSPRVRLSYVVPGATWSPEYDLRYQGTAKSGDGKAVLTVAGVVTQSSGEDWLDAEVWLSTAKPNLGGEAPLPYPIYVHGYEEQKQKTLVQAQEKRADDLKAGKSAGTTAAGAELDDGGKAFVLKLPRKVTVRADGRPYWFPVDDVTTTAKAALVALPALSPYVYQIASLSNPAAYPLMAGVVHVFRGATFVGNDSIEYRAPGEPLEISLGVDEEIALERQDLLQQKKEAGFFSGSQSIAHEYRTILHNRSNEDVTVELREQIPVSKTTDIHVIVDDKTTAGFSLDKVRGHLTWKTAIKRGATEKRDIAFTIKLPKEWAVQ